MSNTQLIHGDCVEKMRELSDNSVDMYFFSPPYDNLRTCYEHELDLEAVGVEIFRTLKEGGVAIMLIQDATKNFKKSGTTFHTISNWISNTGLKLWECCIYNRRATPGSWWTYRFSVDHEYVPIFFKGKRPQYFDKDHMKIPNPSAGVKTKGTVRNAEGELVPIECVGNDKMCCGTVMHYSNAKRERPHDWKLKKQHPATFPEKIAHDFIKAFTTEGMLVVDPFCGSGTTGVQAKRLGRDFIGIDISQEYLDLTKERLELVVV